MLQKILRRITHSYQRSWTAWLGPVLLLLLLLGSLILAWLLRDIVQTIVDEVAFFLWTVGLRLRSLPQDQIWFLFMLIALIHLVRTWTQQFSPPVPVYQSYKQIGPVRGWLETLKLNSYSAELGHIPLRRLQYITLQVLAQQGQHSIAEMHTKLRNGQLDIDPVLQAFLQTGRSTTTHADRAGQAVAKTHIIQSPEMEALLDLLERT
ncbi:MAG: hypothetical protein R6X32_18365 [Chloroflexota bacterium]